MRGFLFFVAATALSCGLNVAKAQEWEERLDSIVVSASRAGSATPVSYTMVHKDQLRVSNPINSLPMTLALQPSVVVSHEGGTGIGYSKMTVRGSKGSQINVTLNGITMNDAESQEVFWVNIPALTSFLSSVQVQRGLGTSANGAGAFGASVNMNTAFVGSGPTARVDLSAGSFCSRILTAAASTGLLPGGLYFNLAWSANQTEGYVRNGWGDASSLLATVGWLNGSNSLKLTYLLGNQQTGITWTGTPLSYLDSDRRYNPEGIQRDGSYYRNHSDNYRQQHLQLNYTRQLGYAWAWTTTLNYTDGFGFNERLKLGQKLKKYGFDSSFSYGDVTSSSKGDVIARKMMANGYWVLNSELKHTTERLRMVLGVQGSCYDGNHYGTVEWAEVLGWGFDYASLNRMDPSNNWYYSHSVKREANAFARAEWDVTEWLTAYADLAYRLVDLRMRGISDDDDTSLDYDKTHHFFNPRAGLTGRWGGHRVYASAALGHREPGRGDIKEIIESNHLEGGNRELLPERMLDIEAGYGFEGESLSASANIYLMEYRNMLLETGEISRSGYAIKDNVGRSYRRGVELAAAWKPWSNLSLGGNLTLSTNKILDYTQYYSEYDNLDDWTFQRQISQHFDRVTMLMSPSVVGMAQMAWSPFANVARGSLRSTTLSLDGKYVGKQYWDNTESADRCIPDYWVANLSLRHSFDLPVGSLGLSFYVNNLFNRLYYADAWVYRAHFVDGGWYQEEGVFPQAPANFMLKISYEF